jgi:hypothetical protein
MSVFQKWKSQKKKKSGVWGEEKVRTWRCASSRRVLAYQGLGPDLKPQYGGKRVSDEDGREPKKPHLGMPKGASGCLNDGKYLTTW